MQMFVEIFQEPTLTVKELQQMINNWLENNPNVHIKYITQSQVQHGQISSMPLTICIWYTLKS
jgi:hypothetical protein